MPACLKGITAGQKNNHHKCMELYSGPLGPSRSLRETAFRLNLKEAGNPQEIVENLAGGTPVAIFQDGEVGDKPFG